MAAGALKLVAETFPWQQGSQFVYTQDNHNSVLGIRQLALDQGSTATCVEMVAVTGMNACAYMLHQPAVDLSCEAPWSNVCTDHCMSNMRDSGMLGSQETDLTVVI